MAVLLSPSTLPGETNVLHLFNRQGGLTPDMGRDADWLSDQL